PSLAFPIGRVGPRPPAPGPTARRAKACPIERRESPMHPRPTRFASLCALSLAALATPSLTAPEIIDLGQPTAPNSAEVFAVNPTGTAALVYAGTRSFLWIEGEGYTE